MIRNILAVLGAVWLSSFVATVAIFVVALRGENCEPFDPCSDAAINANAGRRESGPLAPASLRPKPRAESILSFRRARNG